MTNATILAPAAGSATLCPPGTSAVPSTCVTSVFQTATYYPQVRTEVTPRFDLALGEKNTLTARLQVSQNNTTNNGIGGLELPSAAYNTSSGNQELQISDTQIISSRVINETRFEWERQRDTTTSQNAAPSVSVSGSFNGGGAGGQNSSIHESNFEVQNYTSIQLAKNFIRMGGRLRTRSRAQNSQSGTNGSFTYSALLDPCFNNSNGASIGCLVTSTPCAAANLAANGGKGFSSYQCGIVSQFNLTRVNVPTVRASEADLGLYLEDDWKARPNLTVSYGLRFETQNNINDHADVAPRVSFAYGVGGAKGTPKVVLRGGFGMFYDRYSINNTLNVARQNGLVTTGFTVTNPSAACTPSNISACTAGVSTAGNSIYTQDPSLRTPYILQFAVGADKALGKLGTMSVNYLHARGVHQLASQNAAYPLTGTPAPGAQVVYQYFTEGVFDQNQLVVNANVRYKRVSLFGYYGLNIAKGDTSGGFITVPHNIAADYGRTGFSVRNRVFMAGSITLPHLIQVSPFMVAQSGNPYNVTIGNDLNGDSLCNERPVFGTPNSFAPGTAGTNTIAGCGSFAVPTSSTYTPIPINYCTGPALFTLNVRATKTFGFGPSTNPNAAQQRRGQGGPAGWRSWRRRRPSWWSAAVPAFRRWRQRLWQALQPCARCAVPESVQ